MEKKVLSFMEQYHMAKEGERILAAVSGGADSICLLKILLALKKQKKFQLCVVHVEHGIRGKESMEDAFFVENFCKKHKIRCIVYHCKAEEYARAHKMTLEEGARELRYQYFKQAAEEFRADKIAVAHNQNDCAETMLFHLIRGTGLKGLCGILPVRDRIIRPLLCVEREEIEAYLKKEGQEYCTDETNGELEYTRNKIRHQVLPVLKEINSQAVAHINRTGILAKEMEELLQELTEKAKERYIRRDKNGVHIPQTILEERGIVCRSLLHEVLTEQAKSSRDLSEIHVQKLLELMEKQVGRKIHLPYQMEAERTYSGILLRKQEPGTAGKKQRQELQAEGGRQSRRLSWELVPGQTVKISEYGCEVSARLLKEFPQNKEIPKNMYTKWLDYDKINGSMHLRTRREKDYLVINAEGGRKKIKDYLIDEKIPKAQRDSILLLADGTHIIWAVGYRISEDVKITEHTKRILEIQVDGGTIHE